MTTKHIVQGRSYCRSTERYEVFAYCGYSEEASGSGKHDVDKGEEPCKACARLERADWEDCSDL